MGETKEPKKTDEDKKILSDFNEKHEISFKFRNHNLDFRDVIYLNKIRPFFMFQNKLLTDQQWNLKLSTVPVPRMPNAKGKLEISTELKYNRYFKIEGGVNQEFKVARKKVLGAEMEHTNWVASDF